MSKKVPPKTELYSATIRRAVERARGDAVLVIGVDCGMEGAASLRIENGAVTADWGRFGWSVKRKSWDGGGAGELVEKISRLLVDLRSMAECYFVGSVLIVHELPVHAVHGHDGMIALSTGWVMTASAMIVAGMARVVFHCPIEILSVPSSWWRAPMGLLCRPKEGAKRAAMVRAYQITKKAIDEHEAEAMLMSMMVADLVRQEIIATGRV
jgi:hypothetical protein